MAFWNVDLTTEDGALSAAQIGGFACFIAAALGAIGTVLIVAVARSGALPAIALAGAAAAAVEVLLFGIAGWRLRAGKGVIWGSAAAVLLVLELVMKIVSVSILGILIDAVLLVGVINGVRGSRALQRVALRPDDAAEIFN